MVFVKKCMALVCLASTWIFCSCNSESRFEYEILQIEGVAWAGNVSTSFGLFGSIPEENTTSGVLVPVSEGDLLYMVTDTDLELYYRYNSEDGDHLVVTQDTMTPDLAFVNGSLSQIEIYDEDSFQKLLDQLSYPLDKPVATLYFRDTLTPGMILELKQLESSLRGTGIVLENAIGVNQFNELLSICRPTWMGLESFPVISETDPGIFLEDLELLWITGDILALSRKIQCCQNLESLIIADWKPESGELLPLSSQDKLTSLTLAGCEINSLVQIDFPEHLQQLNLIEIDTPFDISGLADLAELRSLSLAGCDKITSLKSIGDLTLLNRISYPENVSQDDFASTVGQLRFLKIIELLDCPEITDFAILEESESLESLVILMESSFPEQVGSLDQLELLILNGELFDMYPEQIAHLRTQLPDTTIIPGSGLCLGSGWILLLAPLILISWFFFRRRSYHF